MAAYEQTVYKINLDKKTVAKPRQEFLYCKHVDIRYAYETMLQYCTKLMQTCTHKKRGKKKRGGRALTDLARAR